MTYFERQWKGAPFVHQSGPLGGRDCSCVVGRGKIHRRCGQHSDSVRAEHLLRWHRRIRFEPENLVTGGAAAIGNLPQIALGTVVGSAVFMLTAGLGVALMLVPMEVRVPKAGGVAMIVSLLLFTIFVWPDGDVSRVEGVLLLLVAAGLMVWLYRESPFFKRQHEEGEVTGAELVVHGVRGLLTTVMLSETFLGMAVVGMGESLEETARMVTPARRGHPELAWGNVVGTIVVLLTFNLGVIALLSPIAVRPVRTAVSCPVLRLVHARRRRRSIGWSEGRTAHGSGSCAALRRLSRCQLANMWG